MFKWIKEISEKLRNKNINNESVESSELNITPYSSDQPISSRTEDKFNRSPFATRMAETIATRTDSSSIVIGLYGAWGDGKTSVLEMMIETLKEYDHVITVKFNPWHFKSEELLLRGFFATLAEALGKSLPTAGENIGEALKKYGGLLSLGSLTLGGVIQLNPGEAAKNLGESFSTVELDELKFRIEKILRESGRRVVTFIDDIDRLDRTETQAIFKLVKLSASFHHTSYVLAFDDIIVSSALGERYGQGGQEAGRSFLEKIIQVPLHLPPADSISLRELAFQGVDNALAQAEITLEQNQIDTFVRRFVDGLEQKLATPRLAKLYGNALTFSLPLLKGEADPVDLMLVEGIRVFYPHLYARIRDNPDHFLNRHRNNHGPFDQNRQPERVEILIIEGMPGSTEEERARVRTRLLEPLFPRLGNMVYGSEWDGIWASKQKICSIQYFFRYFTYGVPNGDIADSEVNLLLNNLIDADEVAATQIFESLASRRAIPLMITKLRNKVDEINEEQAAAIALAISKNCKLVPLERGPMVIGGTGMQAAILISDLLLRIPSGNHRFTFAENLLTSSAQLSFGIEMMRWFHHYEGRSEERRVFSDEEESNLKKILAVRIKRENNEKPIYFDYAKSAPSLYWLWFNQLGSQSVSEELSARFLRNPEEVDLFLESYIGEAWEVESGLPRRADLRRESYDSISSLIDPDYIVGNLRERYGEQLDNPQFYCDESMSAGLQTAHQFTHIHNQVKNLSQVTEDD